MVTVNTALEEREKQTVVLLQKVGAGFKLHTTLNTYHLALQTAHSTLHAAHCALHTPHSTLRTAYCTVHIVHYTLSISHYTLAQVTEASSELEEVEREGLVVKREETELQEQIEKMIQVNIGTTTVVMVIDIPEFFIALYCFF